MLSQINRKRIKMCRTYGALVVVIPLLQSCRTYGSKKKILTMGEADNQ